jgi:tetratricopeptide (TPR) repeat protein
MMLELRGWSSVTRCLVFAAAGFVLASLAPTYAEAQYRPYNNPSEMRRLPPYCKYTQDFRAHVPGGNSPEDIERWTTLMGQTFIHMHHYCWGLMDTNRAAFLSKSPQERIHYLSNSILEFDYVITKAPPDFAYLPEILTNKGSNLILLGKGPEGVSVLRRAIDIKPDYWPPYAAMADYFKDNGAPAKAREWLEKGLEAAPNTRALERRLAALNPSPAKRNKPQPGTAQ